MDMDMGGCSVPTLHQFTCVPHGGDAAHQARRPLAAWAAAVAALVAMAAAATAAEVVEAVVVARLNTRWFR
eukprot:1123683-Prymnesium_polylepis.4